MSDHSTNEPRNAATSPAEATVGATVTPLSARRLLTDTGAAPDPTDEREAALAAPWEVPIPLAQRRALPPFPVEVYPPWMRDMAQAVADAFQVPPDLPGTLGLSVLAIAGAGRVVVRPDGEWVEPVNLFSVTALVPGSRKSACVSTMSRPVLDAEQHIVEATRTDRVHAQLMAKRAHARAAEAAKAAENAPDDALMADAVAAAEEATRYGEVHEPRLIVDDVTPETAVIVMAQQGGRIALVSAEGGAFATVAGLRYSKNGGNLEVMLKAHAGDMIRVDRLSRDSLKIDHPALTIALTTQPGDLAQVASDPEARDRGLLARFLYCLPENTVGRRRIDAPPIPEATRHAYAAELTSLVVDLYQLEEPVTLTCTPEAVELLRELQKWLEPQLDPESGALASVTDWASKMAGVAVRVAGLLHLAKHTRHDAYGTRIPIAADTMADAIRVAHYYLAHAVAVFDGLALPPELDAARRVLDWAKSTGTATFTRRDAFRKLRSRFKSPGDLDLPLAVLAEHGHIRELPAARVAGRGRAPSPSYQLHPDHLSPRPQC